MLSVSCFFGGTPLGGHLAQLLPGLTELRAAEAQPPSLMQQLGLLEGADGGQEEEEAVQRQPQQVKKQQQQQQEVRGMGAATGSRAIGLVMRRAAGEAHDREQPQSLAVQRGGGKAHDWEQQQQREQLELPPQLWSQQRMGPECLGPGLWRDWQSWGSSAGPPGGGAGDEGFNALGVGGPAGTGVGPGGGRGAGAAAPGLPSAPAGPTASSARSRVVRCALPLDVGAVGRLHTYARLRVLVLVGPGPAAALLEVVRPLTGEGGGKGRREEEGGGREGEKDRGVGSLKCVLRLRFVILVIICYVEARKRVGLSG